jgi:hypothetical protein
MRFRKHFQYVSVLWNAFLLRLEQIPLWSNPTGWALSLQRLCIQDVFSTSLCTCLEKNGPNVYLTSNGICSSINNNAFQSMYVVLSFVRFLCWGAKELFVLRSKGVSFEFFRGQNVFATRVLSTRDVFSLSILFFRMHTSRIHTWYSYICIYIYIYIFLLFYVFSQRIHHGYIISTFFSEYYNQKSLYTHW